ncbi:hypothetical protein T265_09846 [Opisthorchis viverrini]|uniref:Uncharacterized protein n=1 Tax=Opisthorchis viverrini TaxID=6198 RepID=A0A074Z4C6_OPIVI|nr:hypothetical protein T265_09846 [Opisthorchis viverrini]KER21946.1 hypothetical protein T265_09846 [Opisthorchis viverrini]
MCCTRPPHVSVATIYPYKRLVLEWICALSTLLNSDTDELIGRVLESLHTSGVQMASDENLIDLDYAGNTDLTWEDEDKAEPRNLANWNLPGAIQNLALAVLIHMNVISSILDWFFKSLCLAAFVYLYSRLKQMKLGDGMTLVCVDLLQHTVKYLEVLNQIWTVGALTITQLMYNMNSIYTNKLMPHRPSRGRLNCYIQQGGYVSNICASSGAEILRHLEINIQASTHRCNLTALSLSTCFRLCTSGDSEAAAGRICSHWHRPIRPTGRSLFDWIPIDSLLTEVILALFVEQSHKVVNDDDNNDYLSSTLVQSAQKTEATEFSRKVYLTQSDVTRSAYGKLPFFHCYQSWLKWLEREFTDRKVRGSNPTSATRLPLSRLGQPDSIPALVLPSGGMAVRHRKGATAERFIYLFIYQSLTKLIRQSE